MNLKSLGQKIVEEVPWGLYVWQMPSGQWIGDGEGNFLNIPALKGSQERIQKLRDAVREYGIEEGKPVFLSGHRQVDDEEYEYQRQRLEWGLIPDELDAPAFKEDLKYGTT